MLAYQAYQLLQATQLAPEFLVSKGCLEGLHCQAHLPSADQLQLHGMLMMAGEEYIVHV